MVFLPSGVTTLLTDLGLEDPSVGILKGQILNRYAQARIIDLCHHVPPRDVLWASYALAGSYNEFPPGSVHCALVSTGMGRKGQVIVAEAHGHAFVAPDNGVLTQVMHRGGRAWRADLDKLPVASTHRTYHVRDICAPIAALIAADKLDPEASGEECDNAKMLADAPVEASSDGASGVIVGADRFGNLFANLTEEDVPTETEGLAVEFGGREFRIVSAMCEAPEKEPVALFNSFGMLELAIRNARIAEQIDWKRGLPVIVRRR